MNNKAKNLTPDTGADGDNTINTKKGFLLSFPARNKKAPEPGSAIVDAKTIGGTPASPNGGRPQSDAPSSGERREKKPQPNRPEPQNGSNAPRHGKHGGRRDGQPSKPTDGAPQNAAAATGNAAPGAQKKQGGQNGRPNGQDNRGGQNGQGNKGAQNARDPQPSGQRDGEKPQKNNQNNQNRRKNDNRDGRKGDNRDNRENRDSREGGNNNSRDGGNNGNRRGRKGGRREERSVLADLPGLSLLSKDMRAPGGHLSTDEPVMTPKGKKEKELSLEEKYKDAVPLADQIAAEEEKRRHKPRACVIDRIDRQKTVNERPAAANEENAEAAENTAPETPAEVPAQYEIVGIRFREAGKIYYFDPDGNDIAYGTPVIVETARGSEYGFCAIANRLVPVDSVVPPLKKIKRLATPADTEKHLANQQMAAGVGDVFNQKVAELGLPMNLVYAEYTFDNSKLLFYFTAESRIDFRQLVKELAAVFRTRIELRQIGVRDEAKQLGGVGVCGQRLCCHAFLSDFAQVSIKMAKDQGLSLGSAKISGSCGKLMCCLRYEDKVYEEEASRTPRVGCIVETPEGKGTVTESNALSGRIKVALDGAPEAPAKVYTRDDVKIIGFKRQQKDEEPESEELKELEDKEN